MNAQQIIRRAEFWNTFIEACWRVAGLVGVFVFGYLVGRETFRFWWPGR